MENDEDDEAKERLDLLVAEFEKLAEASRGRIIDPKLRAAHKCSIHHRLQIKSSKLCGCFGCLSTFPPINIEEWTDAVDTALCPLCGIDAVIGDASGFPITKEFLSEMCQVWFGYLPEEGKEITKPTIIFR